MSHVGVREPQRQQGASNPSKRHRERLNGELETVACLLPYDPSTISRLDKLSVLRLAVAYLQVKAHFSACVHSTCGFQASTSVPLLFTHAYQFLPSPNPFSAHIPTLVDSGTGIPLIDSEERFFEAISMKALGGFVLVLNGEGDVFYVSENVENFLGFHQSDLLHQSLFELIHSEDRDDIRQQLDPAFGVPAGCSSVQDLLASDNLHYLERNVNARFRCLLDNTCGFLRMDVRGKLLSLHGIPQSFPVAGRTPPIATIGLVAICTPFVPPSNADLPSEDLILKSKHQLDNTLVSMDPKMHHILELCDADLPVSFYELIHPDDATCMAEAHKEVSKSGSSGLLIYRLISAKSRRIYFVQSSCRMFYKNGKADSIGLTHRVLNEVEGSMLLEKRSSLKAKLLSFDDSLLQSPRNLQSAAALPSIGTMSTNRDSIDDEETNQSDPQTIPTCPSKSPTIAPSVIQTGRKRKAKATAITALSNGEILGCVDGDRSEGRGISGNETNIWASPLQSTLHLTAPQCDDRLNGLQLTPQCTQLPSELLAWQPATTNEWNPVDLCNSGIYPTNFSMTYPPIFPSFPEVLPGFDYHWPAANDNLSIQSSMCHLDESTVKHSVIHYPIGEKKLPLNQPNHLLEPHSVIVTPRTDHQTFPSNNRLCGELQFGQSTDSLPSMHHSMHPLPSTNPNHFASFISEATNTLLGPLPI
ncbi:unnamed protein product, partial [Mesorhabditis belari]|uniref:Aryl hydrocarbon receptor n=1 Tax=Mesorhabditis belari TaxID=2138241 RepID=A0AAF3F287_9BILA